MNIFKKIKNLPGTYNRLCQQKPFQTITISTGLILGLGDCITQGLEMYQAKQSIMAKYTTPEQQKEKQEKLKEVKFQYRRALSMAAYGWTFFGPYSYFWYCRILPKLVPLVEGVKITNKQIFKKVLLDETIQSWCFYASFLYLMTVYEGGSHNEGVDKLKKDFFTCYISDLMVWPIIQFINFKKVPIHLQSLVVSSCTIFWGAFLSYIQHRE